MRGAALWPLAGVASVAVHAGLALGLALSLAPEPPPDQTPSETRLDLATYRVDEVTARPADASGETAPERAADGTALAGGAVPMSRAEPRSPEAEALPEVAAGVALRAGDAVGARADAVLEPGDALAASGPGGSPAPEATPAVAIVAPARIAADSPEPVSAETPMLFAAAFAPAEAAAVVAEPITVVEAPPRGARAGAVPPAPIRAEAAAPAGVALSGAEPQAASAPEKRPAGETAVAVTAGGLHAGPARPSAATVAEARPEVRVAAALPPPADIATAALAWSGGEDADVDPVSLAAIQSFMRAGDVAPGASDPVRDGISGLLAGVPCSRLQTVFDPATGALELKGHVPEEGLRAPVLEALRASVGAAISVADNIRILPRPQCGALSGIAAVGLPQSEAQETNPRVVGAGAHARVYSFADGDRLQFELQGPDYPAFFYIDYFDAEGMVLHLQPNEYVPLGRVGVKEVLRIGAANAAGPSLDIRVAPPFGQEIMVAFAASEPLLDSARPIREPAGPYLEALRRAVTEARAADPGFRGEWVYFFVETRAR